MREIFPGGRGTVPGDIAGGDGLSSVDLAAAYAYPPAQGPAAPWVRANMIASVDGAATVDHRSGGLSCDEDHRLFGLLRSLADVIVVGAETVRVEGYGPARIRDEWAGLRAGRPPSPPIAVVTTRMDLDLSARLFSQAPEHARTILITTAAATPQRRVEARKAADVVIGGEDFVDLRIAVASLVRRGFRRILTEGGPRLLSQLAAADLLDDLCLTVSPLLADGGGGRITTYSAMDSPKRLRLAHVLEAGGSLFCRYLRATPANKERTT